MNKINDKSKATLKFCVEWHSSEARHKDYFYAENVNFCRDCFSPDIFAKLKGRENGELVELFYRSNEPIGQYDQKKIHSVKKERFNAYNLISREIVPRQGRFYPQRIIQGLPGVFQVNTTTCRCIEINQNFLEIDLNHPLDIYPLTISAFVHDIQNNTIEPGERCENWIEVIMENGPGMQARYPGVLTDFSGKHTYSRKDNQPDKVFYSSPRFVYHLDSCARSIVKDIHSNYLNDCNNILDLMGSWDSHLTEIFSSSQLTVLGMNQDELKANSLAREHIVQDINQNPTLPFLDKSFDGIICTSSVEYLTKPLEVLKEIARILRSGGKCVITFSNRWFPTKVVSIWEELYEFERLGLIVDYFLKTQSFSELTTVSYRGWPRPQDDKYYGSFPYADPVYGVIAEKL